MASERTESYLRKVLKSSENFEVVACEWNKNSTPLHDHNGSQCFVLVEEGKFENKLQLGIHEEIIIGNPGDVLLTPVGAKHELRCLSENGKTFHVYSPKLSEATSGPSFRQPNPRELYAQLQLGLQSSPLSWTNLDKLMQLIQENSVATCSPLFMNQLFSGVLPESILADQLIAKTKTTLATYEASPVFSLIEKEVAEKLGELAGWKKSEGITVAGGSAANFMALHCARQSYDEKYRKCGMSGVSYKIYASQESHYSLKKACLVLGFGVNALRLVSADKNGKMETAALRSAIQEDKAKGHKPLMVCATAGTTVLGAFDPIEQISTICKAEGIWLHIDGAWGGPALFSQKLKAQMQGIQFADSMTFDAHKLFATTLTCSLFVTPHLGILRASNDVSGADYLFHESSFEEAELAQMSVDRGVMSWQCGRAPDAVRFWTLWKSRGTAGLGIYVDSLLDLRDRALSWIESQERIELLHMPEYLNICLRVKPEDNSKDIGQWQIRIRETLREKNLAMVNFSSNKDGPFLRLILANPFMQLEDVINILKWAQEVR